MEKPGPDHREGIQKKPQKEIDLQRLAEEVLKLLKKELRYENERRGRR
jgi:hypothetical protein